MLSCLYLESAGTVFCLTFAHYALIDRRRLLRGPLNEAALSVVPRRSVCDFLRLYVPCLRSTRNQKDTGTSNLMAALSWTLTGGQNLRSKIKGQNNLFV